MKRKGILFTFLFFFTFAIFPISAKAVEFSIENVKIEAYLQDDGSVKVQEYHLYEFDGKFNGIIRGLIAKEHAEIIDVKAFENGKELPIEKEKNAYLVHRAGKDEKIEIELTYTILDGVQVYEDVAQFYWPFFDDRNESSYENMAIRIFPPSEVNVEDVYAFGHDAAYETETILDDGSIVFKLGEVPSETNGDIRAVYPAALFTNAPLAKETKMLSTILADEEKYKQRKLKWLEKQDEYRSLGNNIFPLGLALMFFICITDYLKRRREMKALEREIREPNKIPTEILTLPGTICYFNYYQLTPELFAATLLDLVRKGNVKQIAKDSFQAVHMNGLKKHEKTFIDWFFYEIGDNGEFSFEKLKNYTKNNNHKFTYTKAYSQWAKEIREEIKESNLYEKRPGYKVILVLLGLAHIPLLVQYIRYDLPVQFLTGLFLCLFFIVYGFLYYKKTWDGRKLTYEWKNFIKNYEHISKNEWKNWSENDRMRAFLYALASGNKKLKEKNEKLVRPFKDRLYDQSGDMTVASIDPFFAIALISAAATSSFQKANEDFGYHSTYSSSSSTSTFTGGGGGVGGGGGGSGAF